MSTAIAATAARPRRRLRMLAAPRKRLGEETVLVLMTIWLVCGILSQKLSLPLFPGTALQIALPFTYLLLAILALGGRLTVPPMRLALLLLFFVGATMVNLLTSPTLTSLVYVYAIYAPLAVRMDVSERFYGRYLEAFQTFGIFVAALVMLDWGFQIVRLPMPNIEHFIPAPIRFFNFNYIQLLNWGSHWYKPNGFFFLETSYVSQLVATSLVIELCVRRRLGHVGLYLVALICSFGGTGFTLVLASLPIILFRLRLKIVVASLFLAPVALGAAAQIGLLDNVAQRSSEFGKKNSSGNQRFAGQFEAIGDNLNSSMSDALLGVGAGQMLQNGRVVWTPLAKVTVEYGVIVSLIYFTLLFVAVFSGNVPLCVSFTAIFQYMFLNGGFLVPVNVFEMMMLTSLVRIRPQRLLTWRPPGGARTSAGPLSHTS